MNAFAQLIVCVVAFVLSAAVKVVDLLHSAELDIEGDEQLVVGAYPPPPQPEDNWVQVLHRNASVGRDAV